VTGQRTNTQPAFAIGPSPVPSAHGALSAVHTYRWPGNVRELRNCLVRVVSLATKDAIGVNDLFPDAARSESETRPRATTLGEARTDAERQRILAALAAHDGKIARTARSLGISRVTLWAKMKRLGLSDRSRTEAERPHS
jgi:DNA-binding NtrC family response regulator